MHAPRPGHGVLRRRILWAVWACGFMHARAGIHWWWMGGGDGMGWDGVTLLYYKLR